MKTMFISILPVAVILAVRHASTSSRRVRRELSRSGILFVAVIIYLEYVFSIIYLEYVFSNSFSSSCVAFSRFSPHYTCHIFQPLIAPEVLNKLWISLWSPQQRLLSLSQFTLFSKEHILGALDKIVTLSSF